MLDFERLRILHAIAMHGSVGGAAKALHVTSSAVSQQIARLELDVGQSLLERNGRGVRLTDAAAILVSHTQQILSRLERAEADFDAQRKGIVGQITVAAFPTAARGLVPETLQRLGERWPELKVITSEREPPESIPSLIRGDLDLVVAQDWLNSPAPPFEGLAKASLLDDIADIALPADHRLARRKIIDLDDLQRERWITWGKTCSAASNTNFPAQWCDEWLVYTLRSRGHEPVIAHTAGEHATQLAFVAAGLGVCVIPRLGRDPLPGNVRVVSVRPSLHRHVYALWRTANARRKAIEVTVKTLSSVASMIAAKRPTKGGG